MQPRRKRATVVVFGTGVVVLAVAAWAGVSAAVSGGGYSPDQQDCPWNANASNSTPGYTTPGCHNLAVNVEGGGTTNGDPNSSNPRYVEYGGNQLPVTNEPATPTVLGLGYPGQANSQHAGCLSADTNPTGGGTGTGCGSSGGGLGASTSYDYWNTVQPGYNYIGVPFPDPLSILGGNPQLGTFEVPVPDPSTTKVNGGAPVSSPTVDTNASGVTGSGSILNTFLTQGLLVYIGMDDNNDAGEHDGFTGISGPCYDARTNTTYTCDSSGAINGPSDGGAMVLSITPQAELAKLTTGPSFDPTQPEGLVNYSEGECADGICGEVTTQQQTVYNGCDGSNPQNNNSADQCAPGTPQSAYVFENGSPASTQESPNCSSGDIPGESTTCGGGGSSTSMDQLRAETPQDMNAEPGVQTYQDPDPQRSPAAPFGTPGTYVGTCGVYANTSSDAVGPGLPEFLGLPLMSPGWIVDQPFGSCGS